ncbi:replication protein [Salmonella enterica]|uniref:hypothetical protein n=1 Tax=Salmonella enterica TaxID=28901 RepID=UPI0006AC9571|nr:hypothetical protein [Salmonella enterica]EAA3705844.1 hypothetical protein [Salmonella enterica subsp. enterica serovar Newport]EBP4009678.1 replication protein [Salmonella enterica subsp. enterica]EBZ3272934.1 hypothetical protein [Salmonella enterica subsp. enterica serovar Anatum]EDQ2035409.1 replication protein [Salmonella enterica subsp. enterica serovar Meleagridis]EDQ6811780.1 replication protein [Salmonella enterica subsp. enterica serovar 4,[5],12:i:-]EDR5840797.1 replication pro
MRKNTEMHKEVKRNRFLQSIDSKTAMTFSSVAKFELMKSEAKALLKDLPVENGYTFIPNSFLERLLKQDFSVDQFSEILKVFREGR